MIEIRIGARKAKESLVIPVSLRNCLYFGSIVLTATVVGLASAWWAVQLSIPAKVEIGPWRFSPKMGAAVDGMYERAAAGATGFGAAPQTDTVHFTARQDSAGKPLTGTSDYRVDLESLPGRHWSLTTYEDGALVSNPHERYSCNSETAVPDDDGGFTIHVQSGEANGNWISTGDAGQLTLRLRLYGLEPHVLSDVSKIRFPQITEVE